MVSDKWLELIASADTNAAYVGGSFNTLHYSRPPVTQLGSSLWNCKSNEFVAGGESEDRRGGII